MMITRQWRLKTPGPTPAPIVLLVLVVGLMGATAGMAQTEAQRDYVEAYIDRTAELLPEAVDLVRETEDVRSRKIMQEAIKLHDRSVQFLQEDALNRALKTARSARSTMWQSVRMAREAMSFEERVRIRSERFVDQYAHLTERARDAGNEAALDFLHRAGRQARRAREQYIQGDARTAFKLLEQADDLLGRAARLLADGYSLERLDRDLEQAAQAIDRAWELLGDDADPAARNLLGEADEALDRALNHRDQGQPGRALQMAGLARRLARRAINLTSSGPGPETVERQIERWDERAGALADRLQEGGSEQARRLFDQARDNRQRAARSLDQDEVERALRQIKAAHDLLGQVADLTR